VLTVLVGTKTFFEMLMFESFFKANLRSILDFKTTEENFFWGPLAILEPGRDEEDVSKQQNDALKYA
jgi:hypothetical protein